ncbi:MAG TPA: hypothetical protein VH164_09075 [Ktedonobacteraceae bacterium]|jgi:hypothetical protein|nr:hypothetical protein [Ktedonobacteraceae bacterium]
MPTWLRTVFGIAAGGLNLFANGTRWPQVALSAAVAGLGVVSHLTSTSGKLSGVGVTADTTPGHRTRLG